MGHAQSLNLDLISADHLRYTVVGFLMLTNFFQTDKTVFKILHFFPIKKKKISKLSNFGKIKTNIK